MSQEEIYNILKKADRPLMADEILSLLKANGIELTESSFYSNLKKIIEIEYETKTVFRYGIGKRYKFKKRFYFLKEVDKYASTDV